MEEFELELAELRGVNDKKKRIEDNHRAQTARKRARAAAIECDRKRAEVARLMEYVRAVGERGIHIPETDPEPDHARHAADASTPGKPGGTPARGSGSRTRRSSSGAGDSHSSDGDAASGNASGKENGSGDPNGAQESGAAQRPSGAAQHESAALVRQYQRMFKEKRRNMAQILSENRMLRARVDALRKLQAGADDHIWQVVAPNKMKALRRRQQQGASRDPASPLPQVRTTPLPTAEATAATTRNQQQLQAQRGQVAVREEQRKQQKARAVCQTMERYLAKETKRLTELRETRQSLSLELAQTRKELQERRKQLAGERKQVQRLSKQYFAAQKRKQREVDAAVASHAKTLLRSMHQDVNVAQTSQWGMQQRELEKEVGVMSLRLERNLKEAVMLQKTVDVLEREYDRLCKWTALRQNQTLDRSAASEVLNRSAAVLAHSGASNPSLSPSPAPSPARPRVPASSSSAHGSLSPPSPASPSSPTTPSSSS